MGYSTEFKKAAVQKYLNRGNRQVNEILQEIGISSPSIYQWRDDLATVRGMKKSSRPQERPGSEKLKALLEFNALPLEKRGEYLRKNGLHQEHLDAWRRQIENELSSGKRSAESRHEILAEKKKVKELERELRRKEKALAEASALLILKKKADLIWGNREDE